MKALILTIVTLSAFASLAASADASISFSLDPRATFLRTRSTDGAPSNAIELATLPFSASPGGFLVLERLGDFGYLASAPQIGRCLVAVFSSSSDLLGNATLDRVLGAIDAGADYATERTYDGDLTDIAEDFYVPGVGNRTTSVTVRIPFGAAFLFFSPEDSLYSDNADLDGDYGVRISALDDGAVPEPSPLLVVLLGSVTLGSLRFFRNRKTSAA